MGKTFQLKAIPAAKTFAMKKLPPLDIVRSLLHYNPVTGQLSYLQQRGPRRPGDPAGGTQRGFPCVFLAGQQHQAAAVAWMLYHGADPSPQHVVCCDGNQFNLAISNLALSPDPPVYPRHKGRRRKEPAWMKRDIRYIRERDVWIAKCGRRVLGEFMTRQEAIAARKHAAREIPDSVCIQMEEEENDA
jgi:hypothetical protein